MWKFFSWLLKAIGLALDFKELLLIFGVGVIMSGSISAFISFISNIPIWLLVIIFIGLLMIISAAIAYWWEHRKSTRLSVSYESHQWGETYPKGFILRIALNLIPKEKLSIDRATLKIGDDKIVAVDYPSKTIEIARTETFKFPIPLHIASIDNEATIAILALGRWCESSIFTLTSAKQVSTSVGVVEKTTSDKHDIEVIVEELLSITDFPFEPVFILRVFYDNREKLAKGLYVESDTTTPLTSKALHKLNSRNIVRIEQRKMPIYGSDNTKDAGYWVLTDLGNNLILYLENHPQVLYIQGSQSQ